VISWKYRLLFIVAAGLIVLGLSLPIWNAMRSINAAWRFRPYAEPYRAKVVGFEQRYGRHTSTAPIVEVEQPDGTKFKFTSSRYSVIQTFVQREPVRIVTRPSVNFLGQPSEILEIDNSYHLWIGDVLTAFFLPALLLLAWCWTRFVPGRENSRRYQLPS
jgi:hypothetical protein